VIKKDKRIDPLQRVSVDCLGEKKIGNVTEALLDQHGGKRELGWYKEVTHVGERAREKKEGGRGGGRIKSAAVKGDQKKGQRGFKKAWDTGLKTPHSFRGGGQTLELQGGTWGVQRGG